MIVYLNSWSRLNILSIYVLFCIYVATFTCLICYFIYGLNFSEWSEQVKFQLRVLDLDLTLVKDKPATLTDLSSEEEKLYHK